MSNRFSIYPGFMFEVFAKSNINIQNLWVNVYRRSTIDIEIYTKEGTLVGFDKAPGAWRLIGKSTFTGGGDFAPKPLSVGIFEPQGIASGGSRSFYVTTTSANDCEFLTITGGNFATGAVASNDDLMIMEGTAKNYPFGFSYGTVTVGGKSAKFSGAIVYDVSDSPASRTSSIPTASPICTLTRKPTEMASPSTISNEWLQAHNQRRQKFHAKYGSSYVPLSWSESIAKSAESYANKLIGLSGCQLMHGYQGDKYGGENLAANYGAFPQTPDQILTRWTENEEPTSGFVFSKSGHFTQVLWRSTHYVGCGQASKDKCHIQVCRYIRPGNCNLSK